MEDLPEDLKSYCVALGRTVANWQTAEERMEFLFCNLADFECGQRLKTYQNTLQITQLGRAFELLTSRIARFGETLDAAIKQQIISA